MANQWVIKVTVDVKGVLAASQQIAQQGAQAGQKFAQGFSGSNQTLKGLSNQLNQLNITLQKTTIGSQKFKQTQREIAAAQREVDKALGKTSAAAKALSSVFSTLGSIGIGFSAVGFLKSSIQEAIELETISRKLSVTLGRQGTAGAMSFARETADRLGLNYKDLINSFGSFTAAATAAGVPLKVQKDLFSALAKAGQVLGLSNDDVRGTLRALQQIASKGTVSMEELRQQLGERLPIALAAAAKGLGLSQAALIKLVETGKLSAVDFFPALAKGLNELTANAGGIPTAAQNFAKLQNAWQELQTSFGTSLLPDVVKGVQELAGALKGLNTESAAYDLVNKFGLSIDAARVLSTQLEVIQNKYGLTNKEVENLLSNVIANTDASRNLFGQLNTSGATFSKIQTGLVDEAIKFRAANRDTIGEVNNLSAAETKRLEDAKTLNSEKSKETVIQGQLAEAIGKTLQAEIAGRVTVQQSSINLGQALISLEESRFGIIRNRNSYELQEAQKRGASERELEAIKQQGDAIDRAALNFKYKALLEQQSLQRSLLTLQQEQAMLEGDLSAQTARAQLDIAKLKIEQASLSGNQQARKEAELGVRIAELGLNAADSKLQILARTQLIEAQIANATSETAENQIKAEAASKGLTLAADSTFKAAKGTAPAANNIQDFMGSAAKATAAAKNHTAGLSNNMNNAAGAAQDFYNALARASGLPSARFTGGPVDAGQTYRVNDGPSGMSLGQEAFLSASGALSLINRPLNSLWTAPSRGTVIPASMTSRLKGAGVLGGGAGVLRGPDPAMAHLSLAVGNLSQEVAELRRKAWNVSVGVRGDGSGLKLAQTMARMR